MRDLLACWGQVAERLRTAAEIALFLDFDGTLAPFRADPGQAHLPPANRESLRRLVRLPSTKIWVISGRRRADLRRRLEVPGVECLGLYGWEDGRSGELSPRSFAELGRARQTLTGQLHAVAGVWVEDKSATFVLHYRGAPADSIRRARAALERALQRSGAGLHVIGEEQGWAVAPREIEGKGKAVRRLWHTFQPRALPVYAGDGASDEAAFRLLAQGITICAGSRRPTRARFRLHGPAQVGEFLARLEAERS